MNRRVVTKKGPGENPRLGGPLPGETLYIFDPGSLQHSLQLGFRIGLTAFGFQAAEMLATRNKNHGGGGDAGSGSGLTTCLDYCKQKRQRYSTLPFFVIINPNIDLFLGPFSVSKQTD